MGMANGPFWKEAGIHQCKEMPADLFSFRKMEHGQIMIKLELFTETFISANYCPWCGISTKEMNGVPNPNP